MVEIPGMIEHTGFRFCPRCGGAEIVNHEQKALHCQQCGFNYYHNAAAAVAGILETPRGILLARRTREPEAGRLDLPGGFVDYDESFEQALTREIHEELNLELAQIQYLGSFPNHYRFGGVAYFTADAVFVCQVPDLECLRYNDEIAQIVYYAPQEIPISEVGFHSMRQALQKYIASG